LTADYLEGIHQWKNIDGDIPFKVKKLERNDDEKEKEEGNDGCFVLYTLL
jgi:hypothetical protein